MSKKWISLLLAVMMLLGLAVPAFAEGEQEAPPTAEIVDEAPQAEEAPPASDETAPAEDAIVEETVVEEAPTEEVINDDEVMLVSEAPMTVAAGGVMVNITGPTDGVHRIIYPGIDGRTYFSQNDGTFYNTLNGSGENEAIYVEQASSLPTQLTVKPGENVRVFVDADYEFTVDNGTIMGEEIFDLYLGDGFYCVTRQVDIVAPTGGQMTIAIEPTKDVLPKVIPYTFYNENWDDEIVVGGEYSGSAWVDWDTQPDGSRQRMITTDGEYSVWVAPGYAIEVLKGGYVAKTQAPSGPAAAGVPAGTTDYILHVNLDADEFVIAAVKQGEHFQVPDTNAPQAETPQQTGGTFIDVVDGVWYADTVEKAYSSGIVKGVTDSTFNPNGTTTRGQTVTMLYRAMGSPSAGAVFSDTSGEVAFAAGWASANGVTNGVSATAFAPNSSITREQLVTMLYRLAGSPAVNTNILATYSDGGTVQSYAQNAVAWAITNGLLTGYGDGTIRPAGVATRAEVCALIMRYVG